MKKILTVLTISLSAMFVSTFAPAAPHGFDRDDHAAQQRGPKERGNGFDKRDHRNADERDFQDRRKVREERGVKRLQQHKWQTGYVMPQHYRGNSYKADFKENNLPKPSRNQQWYKINNDYILVDSHNNNIVRIQQN
ncbi:hypothetical protein G9F31_05130 [Acinetobacter sp. 187]|uniref:RcnB family protein n=1 Tax=Acinetobacter lanii TaxID=2715163 RepID=A0A6G8S0H4_9GAMM|nr:RcnB family protein [Acinetobacter lanii]NHC03153.1 hypothetical protein [Acinetobacter lanii]QIO07614.1 hypothetical protein G8D99_00295 [Acinetobacter lanii]